MAKFTKNTIIPILLLIMYNTLLHSPVVAAQMDRPLEQEQLPNVHRTSCSTLSAEKRSPDLLQLSAPQEYAVQHKLCIFMQSLPIIMSRISSLEAPLMKRVMRAPFEVSPSVLMALEQDRVGPKANTKVMLFTFTKPQKKSQEVPKSTRKTISNYTLYAEHLREEAQRKETIERLIRGELKGLLREWLFATLCGFENDGVARESYIKFHTLLLDWFESLALQPVSMHHLSELEGHLKASKNSKKDPVRDEETLSLLNYLLNDYLHFRARALRDKFLPLMLELRTTYGATLSNLLEELTRENDILTQATEILSNSQKNSKKSTSSGLLAYLGFGSQPTPELNVTPIVKKHGNHPPYKELKRLSLLQHQKRIEKITSSIIKLNSPAKPSESRAQPLEEEFESFLGTKQRKYRQAQREVFEEIKIPRENQRRLGLSSKARQASTLQQTALLERCLEGGTPPSLSVAEPLAYVEKLFNDLQQLFGLYETFALHYQMKAQEDGDIFSQCLLQLRRNLMFQYDDNNVWQLSLKPNFDEKWIFIYSIDIFNKQFPEERNRFQSKLESYIAVIPILEGFFDQIFALEVGRIIENAKHALLFNLECQYLSSGRPFPPPEQHPSIMDELFNHHCSKYPEVVEAIKRQEANVYIGDFPNSPTYEADRIILRSFIEKLFKRNVVDCLKKYNFTEEKVVFLKRIIAEKEANVSMGSANYHNGLDTSITLQMPGSIHDEGGNNVDSKL